MLDVQAEELKPLLKELLHELLTQERSWFMDLVYEAMEDAAMGRAIAEGKDRENVSRDQIFELFES